jgi:class 3 adenylate cyclase/tetratricopeptide (TPR) repeat protein
MKCPNCQVESREEAIFCRSCGASLVSDISCPNCEASNPPDSKFCEKCGKDLKPPKASPPLKYSEPQSYTPKFLADKILTTRSSIEGERKLVTVLFADVANYTAISEKLDPEEVHQIMDGCFNILMNEIHKHEGTINQFTGDGVMALFGAPVAHEDHAQRACYAALSIQKAIDEYGAGVARDIGVAFKMRIGVNTGNVIVGAIGDDLRMDYTAVGDTTNLAARVQQAAKPGEVLVSRETQNIIKGFFQIESIGDHELKGKAEKQAIYRLLSEHKEVRTRFEAGLAKGVTELIGRQPEMQILKAAWERARSGKARLVDVVGEAGVGKSRLIYEFQKAIADEATFLTGVCIHYGRNINFLPLIDIVRSAFGIEEGMSEEEAGRRIQEKATEGLGKMIPFYRNLLSLKVDDEGFNTLSPEGRKFGTFEAVKNLLLSISESKPLVVFIEDVHWIDKISEDFFVFFSHSIQGKTILMLSAYRPEDAPGWAKGPYYRHLGLETLSEKSSGHLIRNILGGLELDPDLEKLIVKRTGGNPFFVEEMVREFMERNELMKEGNRYILRNPIDRLDIPGTVQGIIAARMDRLSEDLKKTMQVASVIGREFAYKILRSILELGDELRTHLTNLVGLEVLYEKALYPELEYIFKHALTQEVAYESLLKQRRREIHGRIARTIEELYADRLEQHYELLAHHWELSESPERAIEYLVLAGEKSNRAMAASTAVSFFSKALDLIEKSNKPQDPSLVLRIRIGRARPLHSMGEIEKALGDFEEAVRLANELDDQKTALACLNDIPFLIYNTTLKDRAPGYCEQALDLARSLKDTGAEALAICTHAYWRFIWKDTDEKETCEYALAIAEKSGQAESIFRCRSVLSNFERWEGNPQKSLQYAEGMLEMAQSVFNLSAASWISFTRAWALTDIGKYNEAILFINEWLDLAEQNALYLALGRIYNSFGWVLSEIYSIDKAFDFNQKSLGNAISLQKSPAMIISASEMQAMAEVNMMENKFDMGDVDEAWNHIIRFEEVSKHPNYDIHRIRWSTRMKDLKGNILLDRGDLDGAESLAKQCVQAATKRGIKKYVGKANRLLGKILTAREQYNQAEARLHDAIEILEKVGNPKQIWMTIAAFAELYKKMKRSDLEREQWQKAAQIVTKTAEGLQDNKLKETFISASPVKAILENAKP